MEDKNRNEEIWKAGIRKALEVLRYMMDLVEDVVDDFEEKNRGRSAILGAQVINGLLFETYSELHDELWGQDDDDDVTYAEWWNDDEWWEYHLNKPRGGNDDE